MALATLHLKRSHYFSFRLGQSQHRLTRGHYSGHGAPLPATHGRRCCQSDEGGDGEPWLTGRLATLWMRSAPQSHWEVSLFLYRVRAKSHSSRTTFALSSSRERRSRSSMLPSSVPEHLNAVGPKLSLRQLGAKLSLSRNFAHHQKFRAGSRVAFPFFGRGMTLPLTSGPQPHPRTLAEGVVLNEVRRRSSSQSEMVSAISRPRVLLSQSELADHPTNALAARDLLFGVMVCPIIET